MQNQPPFFMAQYTAKFFQVTKVKLNCTFFSIRREKNLGGRKSGSPKAGKIRKMIG
jgi:hypothetical protein